MNVGKPLRPRREFVHVFHASTKSVSKRFARLLCFPVYIGVSDAPYHHIRQLSLSVRVDMLK
jgi:hypothetical protein